MTEQEKPADKKTRAERKENFLAEPWVKIGLWSLLGAFILSLILGSIFMFSMGGWHMFDNDRHKRMDRNDKYGIFDGENNDRVRVGLGMSAGGRMYSARGFFDKPMFNRKKNPAHFSMMRSHFARMRAFFGMTNDNTENEDEGKDKDVKQLDSSPVELGRRLYVSHGCNACHTLNGASSVGPSFLRLFGKNRVFKDGTSAKADEGYIAQSIRYPQDKIVLGYNRSMPSFKYLSDKEVTALTEYIKTIK